MTLMDEILAIYAQSLEPLDLIAQRNMTEEELIAEHERLIKKIQQNLEAFAQQQIFIPKHSEIREASRLSKDNEYVCDICKQIKTRLPEDQEQSVNEAKELWGIE